MSIFDTLAENRYQQWLEQKAKPGYQAPASASGTPCKTSYEARVYCEAITRLQKAAALINSEEKADHLQAQSLLTQADELNVQLTLLLENKNLPLVAGMLTKALNELRSELGLPVSMSARRIT